MLVKADLLRFRNYLIMIKTFYLNSQLTLSLDLTMNAQERIVLLNTVSYDPNCKLLR